jgi:hypothetical protein
MAQAREEERMEQTRSIALTLSSAGGDSVVPCVERRVIDAALCDLDAGTHRVVNAASIEDVLANSHHALPSIGLRITLLVSPAREREAPVWSVCAVGRSLTLLAHADQL